MVVGFGALGDCDVPTFRLQLVQQLDSLIDVCQQRLVRVVEMRVQRVEARYWDDLPAKEAVQHLPCLVLLQTILDPTRGAGIVLERFDHCRGYDAPEEG